MSGNGGSTLRPLDESAFALQSIVRGFQIIRAANLKTSELLLLRSEALQLWLDVDAEVINRLVQRTRLPERI